MGPNAAPRPAAPMDWAMATPLPAATAPPFAIAAEDLQTRENNNRKFKIQKSHAKVGTEFKENVVKRSGNINPAAAVPAPIPRARIIAIKNCQFCRLEG